MVQFGFTEDATRRFIERELERAAPSTSFYWESDELEDMLSLLVDVLTKLIAANNKQITKDWESEMRKLARGF
jgi:hypothetical protein